MTAFKKPLCSILAIVLVFVFVAAAPISVFAEDEEVTLSAQEIELNKKTDGDYEYIKVEAGSAVEIIKYVGNDTEVKIPAKINNLDVITVGAGCFEGNSKITSIRFNNKITTVRDAAFKDCTALVEVKNTKNLTSLGVSAFEGCTALTEFEYPESVTDVPERCFAGCTALTEIEAHKNLKNVAVDAFEGTAWENAKADGPLNFGRILYGFKGKVADVVIPEDVAIIEDYVFLGCDFIKSVTFSDSVEEIGLYAFQNCTNLKKVTFGEAMGIVNAGAFKGCSALEAVDFEATTLATIGYEAFYGCTSLKDVKLSETLSDIGDFAFYNTAFKTIEFGKNVASVGPDSFTGNTALEEFVVVSKNKEFSVEDGVLYNKKGSALVKFPAGKAGEFQLPDGVNEIKEAAFKQSSVTKLVVSENSELNYIAEYAFEDSAITEIVIPGAIQKINTATFRNAKNLKNVTFNDGLTYIGAEAFLGCKALENVTLPDTLHDIATAAFKDAGIKVLKTGNGLAKINSNAFAGNVSLTDVTLGANVEKLGDSAFGGCTALTAITLPASMKNFSGASFAGCDALVSVTVDEASTYFKNVGSAVYSADGKTLVLAGTKNDTSIILANGTEKIASGAFALAANIAEISVPETLVKIEDKALNNTAWYNNADGALYVGKVLYEVKGDMPSLIVTEGTVAIADNAVNNASVTSVVLPQSLNRIGNGAFKGSSITTVVIPANTKYIGASAFEGVATLETVTLPGGLEAIATAAFKDCTALKAIALPEALKVVNPDVFAGCSSLADVEFAHVETISNYAFGGCTALKLAKLPATLVELSPLAFVGSGVENIEVDGGNAKYQSLDGVVLVANEELGEDGKAIFETIAVYPAGRKGEYKVPATVKRIAEKAFYNCDNLTAVIFEDGFVDTKAEAFFDCDAITTISMPESAREIGDQAFASCDELREFIVYSNLTDYADNAFEGCNYFNYDAVTIKVEESSATILIVVVVVFVIIGAVWMLVYKKKQKKIQAEILAKAEKDEAMKQARENLAKKKETETTN